VRPLFGIARWKGKQMEAMARSELQRDLEGACILVVEDDTLIMLDLESTLLEAGAKVVGPCRSVSETLSLIDQAQMDAAIIDFGLGGETAAPIAERLSARDTPFLFYTGQVDTDPRLAGWRHWKFLQKPSPPTAIIAEVKALLASRRSTERETKDGLDCRLRAAAALRAR
jgi:DNA-binding response OmpR family regulator